MVYARALNVVQQTRKESLEFAKDIYADAGVDALCEPFFSDIQTHLIKGPLHRRPRRGVECVRNYGYGPAVNACAFSDCDGRSSER